MGWGWYVLLAFLGLLLLLLLTRVRIGFAYENGITLWVGFGFFKLTILPTSDLKITPKTGKPRIRKKPAPKVEQVLTLQRVLEYARLGLDAMGETARYLVIDELTVHAVIGTDDAAMTAICYGTASAALAAFYPILAGRMKIRRQDLHVDADFSGHASLLVRVRISARALLMMTAGLRILLVNLRLRKQHKRQHETGKAVNA